MEDTPERLRVMAASLAAIAKTTSGLRVLSGGIAPDGSIADQQIEQWKADHGRPGEVQGAFDSGQRSLVVSEEVIAALRDVLAADDPRPMSVAELLRALLEAAARAFWLLEPSVDGLRRAERFMNDLHRANEAALQFGIARGLAGEARQAGEELRAKAIAFFEIGGTTRKRVTEDGMLEALTRSAAMFARDDLGDKSVDVDRWVKRMRLDYWWLSKAVHGDKVALDTLVQWGSPPDAAGEAVITYPDVVYEDCMDLALMAYVSASRAAVLTLGYDPDPWNAIVAAHLPRAIAAVEEVLAKDRQPPA